MLQEKIVYLDNAATTPMDDSVIEAITDILRDSYGNASATHGIGRKAKGILEKCRKDIATLIGAQAKEIVFTSGGTEADNMALRCAVSDLGVKNIISTEIEHKAVLDTAKQLENQGLIKLHLLSIDDKGRISLEELEQLLKRVPNVLISIMHANNEIGTMADIEAIGNLAKSYQSYFHSDTVQTMGHIPIDVSKMNIDFLTCSAHKLHGPKGIGFLYVKSTCAIKAMITGGGQERQHRAGTENLAGIKGLHSALGKAIQQIEMDKKHILGLKNFMKDSLNSSGIPLEYNGCIDEHDSLYTVLNVRFPKADSMLLFQLDLAGVCCSGGSACNSGAAKGSHVLRALGDKEGPSVRFSFGRFSTKEDVNYALKQLENILL